MPAIEAPQCDLSPEAFRAWPGLRATARLGGRHRALLDDVLAEVRATGLLTPRIAFECWPIAATEGGDVRLEGGGTVPDLAGAADRLRGATGLVAAVGTIGSELEARAAELFARKQAGRALVLGEVGLAILFRLTRTMIDEVGRSAVAGGVRAGSPVQPGDHGLPLRLQRVAAQLAGAARIGVRVNSAGMIAPVNSISMFVGVGRRIARVEVHDCDICMARERCRYRDHEARVAAL